MQVRTLVSASLALLFWLNVVTFSFLATSVLADDEDYGREFVEELTMAEEDLIAHRLRMQQEEQKRVLDQQAEERDRDFSAKLDRMDDKKARKAALRKKRKDARVVRRILRAAAQENYYGVLGLLNNRYIRLPKQQVTIIPNYFSVEIPEISLFYASDKRIKRAYRARAKQTHPDKNYDGNAVQAFWAVEKAAEILLNPSQRSSYDLAIRTGRSVERKRMRTAIQHGIDKVLSVVKRGAQVLKSFLGPFTVPVLMLSALLF